MERLWNANYTKAWVANFMMNFSFMLLGPLLPIYLSEQFSADKDQIGMILSLYGLTALMIRPFSGYFVDSFPRKVVLLTGYVIFTLLFGGYIAAGTLFAFTIVRTLHGAPMGLTTVANSTVAIDVLPSERRAEGIGYYGLSNNLSTAIAPTVGITIYHLTGNFNLIFALAMTSAAIGLIINSTLHLPKNTLTREKQPLSWDRFFLLKGWRLATSMTTFSFSFGVVSTYLAIYGKEELGITTGSGIFFMVLSAGLVISRLQGSKALRQGKLTHNAAEGVVLGALGYLFFATLHNRLGVYGAAFVIGLANGHMFPAFQTMFINLAPNNKRGTANSTLLISWDLGMCLGVVLGGTIAEHLGYHAAFYFAWMMNALGALFYFTHIKNHFLHNRLR